MDVLLAFLPVAGRTRESGRIAELLQHVFLPAEDFCADSGDGGDADHGRGFSVETSRFWLKWFTSRCAARRIHRRKPVDTGN
ncbi:hypothetical protein [Streptomyces sp. NPDC090994]|uniref:hypothetical protein n=1 Tax=Streptomyces sp. NPDC090994 TaxID=3365969 RepID=UPI00380FA9FC